MYIRCAAIWGRDTHHLVLSLLASIPHCHVRAMPSNTPLSMVEMRNLTEMALHIINQTLSIMDDHESSRRTEEVELKETVVSTGLFGEHLSFISVGLANAQHTFISSLYGSHRGSRVDFSQVSDRKS